MTKYLLSLLSFCLWIAHYGYAQQDSLILTNGDFMVGEAKEMDRGILTFETDYSDSDFRIEWEKIAEIYTDTYFLITLSDGRRFNGTIASTDIENVRIIADSAIANTPKQDVVFLKGVDSDFWSRLSVSLDIGYSRTKANNLQQFSVRSAFGFIAERWSTSASYNNVRSSQDEINDIQRMDAGITYRYFLPRDWYPLVQISWLSNTEQNIDLRTITKLGLGKYLIHTNRTYWGVQGGVSFNNENFSNENGTRQSGESFFGTELNMYDIGDLNLLTNVVVYPSLTESRRLRVDYTFDAKYDLPLDFYFKLGFTLNYDNQPVENASTTDYVFQTTFGWEL
jgi:putative salt-induced outer membrane protein YdiY